MEDSWVEPCDISTVEDLDQLVHPGIRAGLQWDKQRLFEQLRKVVNLLRKQDSNSHLEQQRQFFIFLDLLSLSVGKVLQGTGVKLFVFALGGIESEG